MRASKRPGTWPECDIPTLLAVHGADVHDGRVGIWADLVEGRTTGVLQHPLVLKGFNPQPEPPAR